MYYQIVGTISFQFFTVVEASSEVEAAQLVAGKPIAPMLRGEETNIQKHLIIGDVIPNTIDIKAVRPDV